MYCCSNCFKDSEIKAIIEGSSPRTKLSTGKCDFCSSTNSPVYDLAANTAIAERFDELLDVYTPISELPADFPKEKTDLLKNILYNNWEIFNLKPDSIYKLIIQLCTDRYSQHPELFNLPVGIAELQSAKYLEENSILKSHVWEDFSDGIKNVNRFHSDFVNKEELDIFLRCASKKHKAGEVFYRARICTDEKGFKPTDMGAPPMGKAKAGRVNPEGLSILYLSDTKDTTLYEIRAGLYDYVTVGRFKLEQDIEVINLIDVGKISPFIGVARGFDLTEYAINIDHLKMISQEIAKPLRNDNTLDYLPTQYISDFIRSKGYAGIEYISTMNQDGTNLAVFDSKLLKCTKTEVYDISSINYKSKRIKA